MTVAMSRALAPRSRARRSPAARALALGLLVIGGGACGGSGATAPSPSPPYLPLAIGNRWQYECLRQGSSGAALTLTDSVADTVRVAGRLTYAFALEIPDSAGHVATQVQLLANDSAGNTRIEGYVIGGQPTPVTPTVIVAAQPQLHTPYDYPAPGGGTITRAFKGIESSNPTPLGTFTNVAPYYDNGGIDNYGYVPGKGIVEQDHANFEFDCLIESVQLH